MKMALRRSLQLLILVLIALALGVTTGILAPLPLFLVRRHQGRIALLCGAVIGLSILAGFGAFSMMVDFGISAVLVALFSECESAAVGFSTAALLSVVGSLAVLLGGLALMVLKFGFDPVSFIKQHIDLALAQFALPPSVNIDKHALLQQAPSAIVIMVILALWMNVLLVPRFELMLSWRPTMMKHLYSRIVFVQWKLPTAVVWLALSSVAGTFLDVKPEWLHVVAANSLNVLVLLYFFQGLAIIVHYFNRKRVAPLWRSLAYLLIFLQLFLVVACLGFADIWMSFRDRSKPNMSAVA